MTGGAQSYSEPATYQYTLGEESDHDIIKDSIKKTSVGTPKTLPAGIRNSSDFTNTTDAQKEKSESKVAIISIWMALCSTASKFTILYYFVY